MPRGHIKLKHRELEPDSKYESFTLSRFANYIMLNGKKSVAERIIHIAIEEAAKILNAEPLDILDQVLRNVGPLVEVKSKRIGGANYQIPVEVGKERRETLAMRWIIDVARKANGKPMGLKMATEFVNAYNGEGSAMKKKEETHRMAEANKAFAHFARF